MAGTIDVIARLQLKAEQFSSEAGRATADLSDRLKRAAENAPRQFNSAFADVNKIITQAVTLPRNAGGSLDLSSEIASLHASAAAAENRADAFREMQTAALRAAEAGHSEAAALRQDADAAMVAVRASEEAAAADRRRIAALEGLQAELNRSASVTTHAAGALGQHAGQSDKMRQAMAGASYQVQDFVTQVSMGANPIQAFMVQGGQLAGQFMYVEGAAGAAARFLMGPWGLALQVGVMALAPLIGKLLDTDEAAKQAASGLETFRAKQLDIGRFIDATTGKLIEQNATLVRNAILTRQGQIDKNADTLRTQTGAAFAAARKAQGDDTPIYTAGGVTQPNVDRDLQRVIRSAGGDVVKLDAGLAALAKRRPDLQATVRTISDAAAQAVDLARENQRLGGEIDQLSGKTRAHTKVTAGQVEQQVRLATSTTALERARASYDIVRSRGDAAAKAGGAALAQYRTDLTAASNAINAAEAAEKSAAEAKRNHTREVREEAKAQRDAARDQRQLASDLREVLTRYDPAAAAAARYADELERIAKLVAAGKLTPQVGERYRSQARVIEFDQIAAENQRRNRAAIAGGEQILGPEIAKAEAFFDEMRMMQRAEQAQSVDKWRMAADALRDAAGVVSDVFGVRLSGPLGAMLSTGGIEGRSAETAKLFTDSLARSGVKISKESLDKLTGDLSNVLSNASYGQIGGSVFASITGGKQSALGSSIGGVLGGEAGKAIGSAISTGATGLLKTLGGAAGPLGAIAGGVLGSLVGGLFKKRSPSGSADITGIDPSAVATSGKLGSALTGDASSVQKSLVQIAEQLGAVTGAFSVSIGKSGDWYHVAGSAGADVSASHPKSPLIYEGKDEAAAVQAAILNALQDGAIKGISEASQRILQSGQDLDAALQKALAIEAVPRDLKAMLDPVGAAIDDLNRKWTKTVDALKEGGASAEQMAQAERLHSLQLDQVKASTSSASQALKDFLTSLKVGSASPYSLRDQEATARATLNPYLDQIAAGQSIDQAKYQSAANAFLDIERQLYGSTQAYFAALDAVQAATNKAISAIDNATPISAAVPDPFTKATAENAAKTAAAVQTGNEMTEDTNTLLARLVDLQAQLVSRMGDAGGGFIGADRLFAAG